MKLALSALLLTAATALADDVTFALDPVGGTISGAPGDTAGWGFTLTNTGSDWLLVSNSTFVSPYEADYTDFISMPFMPVGPLPESDTWTQPFDATAQTGAGSFAIDPMATAGAEFAGSILLTYDLYNVDPNDHAWDPVADLVSSGNTISAAAEVDVTAPVLTPEPNLTPLAVTFLLWGWRRGFRSEALLRRERDACIGGEFPVVPEVDDIS